MKQKSALFWSGGKDCALALYYIQKRYLELELVYLVTTLNEEFRRISMHGVSETLLDIQAERVGIPLYKMLLPTDPSNKAYQSALQKVFEDLKLAGVSHIVFGDIFLEDVKQFRLSLLQSHQMEGVFPLWGIPTRQLAGEFIDLGFSTITCCISTEYLTEAHLGRQLDHRFIEDLPAGVDPCGENGEFHTFCFDGPVFQSPVEFKLGEKQFKPLSITSTSGVKDSGFWFVDIVEGA